MLTGNTGNNLLDGQGGADSMTGGAGNDTYVVDNVGDTVTEGAGGSSGTDLVQSSLSYTLGANVENLTLTGGGNINGTGNSARTTSSPATAATTAWTARGGADTMSGGAGNDTYVVDNAGDIGHRKRADAGTDTGREPRSATRSAANVENLTLTGGGNDRRHRQRRSTTSSPATPATTGSTA